MLESIRKRFPALPPHILKALAIAFGVGLLLFLLVWLNSRRDYDFYKADGTEATVGQSDALPVPYLMMQASDARHFHRRWPAVYRLAPLEMSAAQRAGVRKIGFVTDPAQ